MEQAGQPALGEAMNRLWAQFLPQLQGRVAVLEAAAAALAEGNLALAGREQASSEAHKLAGVLGTFGLAEGTLLAREAEAFYSGPQADPAAAVRLAEIAALLRAMLAGRR
jgi:HPt (histidine-containing phosphotransfer) domain-containing protein